ncbi:MAG: T9SS type A sorting domain-containing protein, partial [Bacteroidales bacterium]|nr:T9SS type A sorting domain-containing protein [Bacteroidales bacterium]
KVRLYDFDEGIPASSSASWLSNYFGYGSGILLADVTRDDILDLIYGGWWLPTKIAIGNGVNFQIDPSYTSSSSSVVEAIQIADLGKENIQIMNENILIGIESAAIHLTHKIVENILNIYKNGVLLESSDYSYIPGKNWISFKNRLYAGDELEIQYEYCYDGDLVITNWDSYKGNYIFYNTNPPVGLITYDKNVILNLINIYPNPANEFINIDYVLPFDSEVEIEIYNLTGDKIKIIYKGYETKGRNILKYKIDNLRTGIYFIKVIVVNQYFTERFIVY